MPGLLDPLFPFGGGLVPRRAPRLRELRTFELPINGYNVSETSFDFGIDPCDYAELPCRCLVIFRIGSIPTADATLPVTVVIPTNSTTSTITGSTSTAKSPVVDKDNNPIVAGDITANTERLALLDKNNGTFRILESTTSGATAADAPTEG